MKKVLVFLIGMLLVSCHDSVTSYSPQQIKEIQYEQAFEKAFGKISPSQTWGFSNPTSGARAITRSAQPNSNQWGTNDWDGRYKDYPKPADITVEERAKVLAVFNQKGKESYTDLVNWTNFFVQQVYCGPNGEKMNQLACKDPAGHEVTEYLWSQERGNYTNVYTSYDDEVNNFNGGKYSGNAEQGCMLMFNSSTSEWSFKTSQSGGERIYGHWRMEYIPGYGYYVGLDHEAWRQAPANANEEDKRDFIYNDWIIKIVPGKGQTPPDKVKEEGMIICEDLGTIGDFDFNDVVFYAKVWESGKTDITLYAAGGTLDVSVAGVNVGEVMGKMVNTGLATVHEYSFVASDKYNSLIDIPIIVSNSDEAGNVTSYELSARMGKAPQKICVPLGFKWCLEYKPLYEAYPGFKNWVTGASDTWAGNYNSSLVY
jgi:hypothetical protein